MSQADPQPIIELLLGAFADSLRQVERAVADIPDDRMAFQPPGIVNHPAWTLSHLATAAGGVLVLMGDPGSPGLMEDFARFGSGSTPSPDRAFYSSKAEMLERLRSRHARATELVRSRHGARFNQAPPDPFGRFGHAIGPIAAYLLASHEPYHIGQISQWRRLAGLVAC